MKITIIGWYGTETQGDIAILDGILSMISKLDKTNTVFLGSLFTFYTERTLFLNDSVFKKSSPNLNIEIFDLKNAKERYKYTSKSDLLLIGGGPLDNIREVILLEKCFKIAQKKKIPSMIFGCGIDVLNDSTCIKALKHISEIANVILVRDNNSKDKFIKLFNNVKDKIFVIQDPAILSIVNYYNDNKNIICKNNSISINIRQYTIEEYEAPIYYSDLDFISFIKNLAQKYDVVNLVPMHTFYCGEDDRYYLSKLKFDLQQNNINLITKPQNLHELYNLFLNSYACVGMRYHSIVMQTILNGNNLILDYTNTENGKIISFLKDNSLVEQYKNRICHLQKSERIDFVEFINELQNRVNPADILYDEEYVISLIKSIF